MRPTICKRKCLVKQLIGRDSQNDRVCIYWINKELQLIKIRVDQLRDIAISLLFQALPDLSSVEKDVQNTLDGIKLVDEEKTQAIADLISSDAADITNAKNTVSNVNWINSIELFFSIVFILFIIFTKSIEVHPVYYLPYQFEK